LSIRPSKSPIAGVEYAPIRQAFETPTAPVTAREAVCTPSR
jgi:hypothetical protein